MQGESKRDMTASKVRQYIFDRVCLYSESTLEALWGGEMANMPEKYLGCEITVIGARKKGVLDIGINEAIPGSEGEQAAG